MTVLFLVRGSRRTSTSTRDWTLLSTQRSNGSAKEEAAARATGQRNREREARQKLTDEVVVPALREVAEMVTERGQWAQVEVPEVGGRDCATLQYCPEDWPEAEDDFSYTYSWRVVTTSDGGVRFQEERRTPQGTTSGMFLGGPSGEAHVDAERLKELAVDFVTRSLADHTG